VDAAPQQPAPGTRDTDRVLTIPNMISFARLLGVPIFLWLYLVAHQTGIAVAVLAIGGTSDWIDGYLARRLHQVSRLGELMDPLADRLYILATVVALTVGHVLTWQFTVILLARDVVMAGCLLLLRRHGFAPPPVHYIGKTATFILLFAFPTLLLAHALHGSTFWYACGWALAWWGLVLYWVAGLFYLAQAAGAVRADRAAGAAAT
jgi:cardiolipin synthase